MSHSRASTVSDNASSFVPLGTVPIETDLRAGYGRFKPVRWRLGAGRSAHGCACLVPGEALSRVFPGMETARSAPVEPSESHLPPTLLRQVIFRAGSVCRRSNRGAHLVSPAGSKSGDV